MATFTISIPTEMKKTIDEYPEINWSEYLKKQFAIKLKELRPPKKNARGKK